MKEITSEEVSKLYDCIRELSEYHNTKSVNFKGFYPLYEKYGFRMKSLILGIER